MPTRPRVRVGHRRGGLRGPHPRRGLPSRPRGRRRAGCVTATRPERARAFARQFGVARAVGRLPRGAGRPEVDVVDLCAPSHHHAAMAIEAARGGQARDRGEAAHRVLRRRRHAARGDAASGARARPTRCWPPPRGGRAALLRGELGVRAADPEGAPAPHGLRRPDPPDSIGEESHSGTHAPVNKRWVTGGGGSLIGKGCHPLGGALYLKADEGRRLRGRPVRPVSVMAEVAQLTETATFRAAAPRYLNVVEGADVEDWGRHADHLRRRHGGADLGRRHRAGRHPQLDEVYGAKAVVLCNINPNDAVQAYAPDTSVFGDEYIMEKIETKAGLDRAPARRGLDDRLSAGDAGLRGVRGLGREPLSGGPLARDVTAVIYGAYLSAAHGRRIDLRPYLSKGSGLTFRHFRALGDIAARGENVGM